MNADPETFEELIENIKDWADEKCLLSNANIFPQTVKVMEEVGETAAAVLRKNYGDIQDGIGDVFVTLIILAMQHGMEPFECLESAWEEIKHRTGKTRDGVFIKEKP